MSIHNLPANIDIDLARHLLQKYLRLPDSIIYGNGPNQPPTAIEYTSDLTPAEVATLQDVAQRYQDAKADYDQYETLHGNLKAYLSLNSPNLAQSAAALKVCIRVVIFIMDTLVRVKL